jgi:hypothetical protein
VTAAASGCVIRALEPPGAIIGIDVGEDFLDLAVLRLAAASLEHHRVALGAIAAAPAAAIGERLRACCPDLGPRWLALIDSPRWPLDLDCAQAAVARREPVPLGRSLDSALRELLRAPAAGAVIRLSMFPTPRLDYFTRCARHPPCKPHLRAAYAQLFGPLRWPPNPPPGSAVPAIAGGTFTRFMLAGFVAFRALDAMGVQTLEAYPELQFRLSTREPLRPKRAGAPALAQRAAIGRKLRRVLRIKRSPLPATIDQADAEILVLSAALAARRGALAALEHPAEGRFLLTIERSGVAAPRASRLLYNPQTIC